MSSGKINGQSFREKKWWARRVPWICTRNIVFCSPRWRYAPAATWAPFARLGIHVASTRDLCLSAANLFQFSTLNVCHHHLGASLRVTRLVDVHLNTLPPPPPTYPSMCSCLDTLWAQNTRFLEWVELWALPQTMYSADCCKSAMAVTVALLHSRLTKVQLNLVRPLGVKCKL